MLVLLAQMDVSHAKPGGLPSVNVPVKNWEDALQGAMGGAWLASSRGWRRALGRLGGMAYARRALGMRGHRVRVATWRKGVARCARAERAGGERARSPARARAAGRRAHEQRKRRAGEQSRSAQAARADGPGAGTPTIGVESRGSAFPLHALATGPEPRLAQALAGKAH